VAIKWNKGVGKVASQGMEEEGQFEWRKDGKSRFNFTKGTFCCMRCIWGYSSRRMTQGSVEAPEGAPCV